MKVIEWWSINKSLHEFQQLWISTFVQQMDPKHLSKKLKEHIGLGDAKKSRNITTSISESKSKKRPIVDYLSFLDPLIGIPSFLVSRVAHQTLKLSMEVKPPMNDAVRDFAYHPVFYQVAEHENLEAVAVNLPTIGILESLLGIWSGGALTSLTTLLETALRRGSKSKDYDEVRHTVESIL